MRNGEGLQLIPNTVARLAIIFFATWYVKIACFHNIKRCWKWPASHRLDASWFSLCVAWMNGFRAQGTGLSYTGCVNTGLVIGLPEMPGCCQYSLDIKLKVTIDKPFFSKLHELIALMSHLNALVSNDNHCTVMSRYEAQPRWELTAMLGRLAAIGLSYYHERALCRNNEILHKNILSLSFSTLKVI